MRWWIKLIAALAALALLLCLLVGAGKLFMGVLRIFRSDGGPVERDPMFAEEAELTTRPPDLFEEEEGDHIHAADNSANWDQEYHTPVDMTAEDLAME